MSGGGNVDAPRDSFDGHFQGPPPSQRGSGLCRSWVASDVHPSFHDCLAATVGSVGFKQYKDRVARRLEERRLASDTGRVPRIDILRAYAEGIRRVWEGQPWHRAFDLAGLRGELGTSEEFLKRLRVESLPCISPELPSAADLPAIYPRRTSIPVDELFRLVLRLSRPRPALVLPQRARLSLKGRPAPPLPPLAPPRM